MHDKLSIAQMKGWPMTITRTILMVACLISIPLLAQQAKVTELMSKDLTNLPGKEGLMVMVEYPRAVLTQSIATMPMVSSMCWKAPL